ncbi:MAG: class I SAM-dependent rRNA methyltransferase [Gammaproteobacteria bacterium]|nr:class I SAM-dependent rRNA methyltransferase [Gammaproteobacteria bacterium]
MYKTLQLRKNEEHRLRGGHLWVYSNEVEVTATPLTGFAPGELAVLVDYRSRPLGTAYVNPHSLICARLLGRAPDIVPDAAWFARRLEAAAALRKRLFDRPFYRLVYGESDALPGLVIDRYDTVCSVQLTTAGMDLCKDAVLAALQQVVQPEAVVLRNDAPIRALEGLAPYVEALPAAPERVLVEENGLRFELEPLTGQKTGWFYDHRMNRARLPAYVRGRRVLDMFSYSGAWGVQAAAAGARQVVCVDESRAALDLLLRNARMNGVADRIEARHGEAFATLKALHEAGEVFDVVVLDPPAFIKRRKDKAAGLRAYQRLNQLAMQLLDADGILISASCSFHLAADELRGVLQQAALHAGRELQILEQGHQGPDHPVHPAIPETAYLKCLIARVHRGDAAG